MKRSLIVALFLFAVIGSAAAAERSLLARVTVYWASGGSGADRWTRRHIAASGTHLRNGHCAVDPRRIPYGSKVKLADETLVAVDTGSAVRTRRAARVSGRSSTERSALVIDRFFETKAEALAWARRNPQFMTVRIAPANEQPVNSRTALASQTPRRIARRRPDDATRGGSVRREQRQCGALSVSERVLLLAELVQILDE